MAEAEVPENLIEEKEEEESIYSDANAAVIISFIEQFGSLIFVDKPPIMSDLMGWISNSDEVAPELQDMHVKLLRKLKKSVVPEKWEKAIIKFCYSYGGVRDAFEVERFGYKNTNNSIKLRILKELLEQQFDVNVKFKNNINTKPSSDLRFEPFGNDKDGNIYYCQMDEQANIKVYQENQDEETWSVVASNRDELAKLIEELKGHRPIKPILADLIDEDSSSNSKTSAKEEIKTEVEQPVEEPVKQEQQYSIQESEEFPLKQTIRLIKKTEISDTDVKPEPETAEPQQEVIEQPVESSEQEIEERAIQKKRRRK